MEEQAELIGLPAAEEVLERALGRAHLVPFNLVARHLLKFRF
jgi:hypothetical protein